MKGFSCSYTGSFGHFGLISAAALIVAPTVVSASPARQSGQEITVLVGAGQDTTQLLNYFPASVRVRAGDTVTWKINGDELHTVAFTKGALFPPFPAAAQAPGDTPGELIPSLVVPTPGGGPTDLMINPWTGFPSRRPGDPVEAYSGPGTFISSCLLQKQTPPGAPPNQSMSVVFDTPGRIEVVSSRLAMGKAAAESALARSIVGKVPRNGPFSEPCRGGPYPPQ